MENYQAPFPHCDSLVLHRAETCEYCAMFPDLQAARTQNHVNFTGEYDPDKALCPSEDRRPLETIHRWYGNRPYLGADDPSA